MRARTAARAGTRTARTRAGARGSDAPRVNRRLSGFWGTQKEMTMGYVMPHTPTVMQLYLLDVGADQRVQQRVELNLEKVAEYAALYQEGADLGPLVAFTDGHS